MKRRILIILITTLVFGSIGSYTMLDVKFLLEHHDNQVIKRGRRTGRRREDQEKLFSNIDM